mgnify:CR=1 FL=1
MKVYQPRYDNGWAWSDHFRMTEPFAFTTSKECEKWILDRGYVKKETDTGTIYKSICKDPYYADEYYVILEVEIHELAKEVKDEVDK